MDILLLPKLISLNSINFDYAMCDCSKGSMTAKDKRDKLSKEGAGRVNIFKECGIKHCYTIEANYHCGRRLNYLSEKINVDTGEVIPETTVTDN